MLHHQYQESFIYRFFNSYYSELLREKQRALSKAGVHLSKLESSKVKKLVEQIIGRLESFLRDSEEQALKGGAYIQSGYKEVQYIAVALTDEVFLNLKWQGQEVWDSNILESRLFNTRKAGIKIFEELDAFLERHDTMRTDIAAVYHQVLALNFQGKYRGGGNLSDLDTYMGKLYEFIYNQSPKVFTHDYDLFPESLEHTMEEATPQRLPDPHRWYYLYLGGVFAFLLMTYIVWFDSTFEVKTALYEIIQLGK